MEGLQLFFLAFVAFVGFVIYFIFKILQFVMQAINLYKDIIKREDTIIKLLEDIKDGKNLPENRNTDDAASNPATHKKSSSPQKTRNSSSRKTPCEYCGDLYDFEDLDMYKAKYICSACYIDKGIKDSYKDEEVEDIVEEQEGKKPLTEMRSEKDLFEEAYLAIKENHFTELKDELNTDEQVSILNNMLRLSYDELVEMEAKPEDLTKTAKDVLNTIIVKIKQHKKQIGESNE